MTREEIISGLQMTMDLIQFDPGTGNVRPIYTLNDLDKTTYVACKEAIEALKAQLPSAQPKPCEDAVSRQTLQKELALYPIDDVTTEDEVGYNRAINDVQKMVLHLPSAQPQSTMGQVNDTAQSTNDCISRQAAIELIERMKPYHQEADDIAEMIANMPSAQPEIIRCKDCTKCQIDTVFHDYWCDGRKVWKDHYCGYAERKEEG